MQYVFGPAPSRRLGQSLGIDTIPLKTCNWNCVYCQLGRSKPLCNTRADYVSQDVILTELEGVLSESSEGSIDWITFVGSGEPTLHTGIGELIQGVNELTDIPVAVITNGSLLFDHSVAEALSHADAVMPSLDAGTPELYKKINRPHPGVPFERYINGLCTFREAYAGQLWVEVMLINGVNDTDAALQDIASILKRIHPDKIHLGLPTRPPAEKWVQPPSEEGIMRATVILGTAGEVVHPHEAEINLTKDGDVVTALIGIISRHPLADELLHRALAHLPRKEKQRTIEILEKSGAVQIIERFGKQFWCATPSVFPETLKVNDRK